MRKRQERMKGLMLTGARDEDAKQFQTMIFNLRTQNKRQNRHKYPSMNCVNNNSSRLSFFLSHFNI